MKITILSFLFFTCVLCHAQTKVIAHKSHSGSSDSFRKAYRQSLFDVRSSNFGLGDKSIIVLDTVIAINDTVTVLQFREARVCISTQIDYKDLEDSAFQARTDTILNHSVFTRKNNISDIKISNSFYPINFKNPIDEVVFIGFKE